MPKKSTSVEKPNMIAPASPKQEMIVNSKADITLAGGAAGSGKALRHGEKVLTVTGFKNIEDIRVGDSIITPKNTVEKVTGVYPQGKVEIYRVTFHDGSYVDTCKDHLWKWRKSGCRSSTVGSTLDILNWMNTRTLNIKDNTRRRPLIDLIEPVELRIDRKELPIKPYTLGVLLGDGSLTTNGVCFTTRDREIVDNVVNDGYSVKKWSSQNNDVYGIHLIQKDLRDLKLIPTKSNTKFIPEEYKIASIEDKFQLIQGLMDTDGYVAKDGSTTYTTTSEKLKNDITEILRSLGFTVTCTTRIPFYRDVNQNKVICQKAYTLYIRGRKQNQLFKLSRKLERCKYKPVCNAIVSIEKIEDDYATCISISGGDKLFITSNYIVTHNTLMLLLTALKYMQHPKATGAIFRRYTTNLTNPGSIWSEAVTLYSDIYGKKLKINSKSTKIVFPNGAVLKFSHMQYEKDMYNWKGAQLSFCAFDEASEFTESQIKYLISRMRNIHVDYKPKMFLTTNPDYDCFLRLWIQDYYLDPVTGIPKTETAGHIRYFVTTNGNIQWYNTLEEAQEIHGKGDDSGIMSFTFIPATCKDNPPLLKAQPDYISRLMSQDRVEVDRLLHGSWFARLEASGHFKRTWCQLVNQPNGRAFQRVRAWDFAFTKPSEVTKDPDWTAGVLLSKDKAKMYTVEDVVRMRDRVNKVEELVFQTALNDGTDVIIGIPVDPNAQAAAYARDLQRRLGEMGYTVILNKPVKSKVTRFAPFGSVAQAGFVNIVEGDWNKAYFDELEVFDGSRKFHDDQADATSDAFYMLNRQVELPSFTLPEMTRTNQFNINYS